MNLHALNQVGRVLLALGFKPQAAAPADYRRRTLAASMVADEFLELRFRAPTVRDPLVHAAQLRGPWRLLPAEGDFRADGPWMYTAELPLGVFAELDPEDWSEAFTQSVLALVGTAEGESPDWIAPAAAETEDWVPPQDRFVRTNDLLCPLDVLADGSGFRLSCCLGDMREDLTRARRSWIRHVLLDWQTHTRLIRLTANADGIQAHVDLTGVPGAVLEAFAKLAAATMRAALPPLIAAVDVLTTVDLGSAALEAWPEEATPVQSKTSNDEGR